MLYLNNIHYGKSIIIFVIILSIISCSNNKPKINTDNDTITPPNEDSIPPIIFDIQTDTVFTTISKNKFSKEIYDFEVLMINNTNTELIYTDYLRIDYFNGTRWEYFDNNFIEVEVALRLYPKTKYKLLAPFNIEENMNIKAGKYRISKTISSDKRKYFLYAEFYLE